MLTFVRMTVPLFALVACGSETKDAGDRSGDSGSPGPGGEPITAPARQWTWIDFPESRCRDGSTTGIAVSLEPSSDKVMIYLEGGGACFNEVTCGLNPANSADQRGEKTAGLFSRANARNPVRDWSHVYVPYCTGDVHAGTNADGAVEGVPGTQQFVGRKNMEAFLERIVPTFPDVSQVLLTGISAGGFGAAANAALVQRAFGQVPVRLIDDSGPPMSGQYLPPCFLGALRSAWGLDGSVLADCGAACPDADDYLVDFSRYLAGRLVDAKAGVIETTNDEITTLFFGFAENDCAGLGVMPEETFRAGLLDFRTRMGGSPGFGTYFITGTQHTWLGGDSLYTQSTGGVPLIDWVRDIAEGTAATHIGP
jgi:hypothetical protein